MGVSLWDQVWLPLLIGVAIQTVVAALCFLSARLGKCLVQQMTTQTAVGVSAHDQPLPDSDAVAHANGVPGLEMGNGYGPAEGGESVTETEMEMGIVNGREGPEDPGHESRSKRSPCACRSGLSSLPARGSCFRMKRLFRRLAMLAMNCFTAPEELYGSTSIIFLLKGADSAPR